MGVYQKWNFTTGGIDYSSPTVADLDAYGSLEILIGSTDNNLYCLNQLGIEKWHFTTSGDIDSTPSIADLDNDGFLEVLVGSDDNNLYCINYLGSEIWRYSTSNSVISSPTIADLDDDGTLEILVGSTNGYFYCLGISGVSSSGDQTNIVDMTNALLTVKNEIGDIHAIIGHSLGGSTTALALNRGLDVPKVILSAPPTSIKQVIDIYSLMLYLPNKIKQKLYSETAKRIEHSLEEVSAYTFAHTIQTPLLLFHDVSDELVPYESSENLAKIWKETQFVTTQSLGHRRLLWNSDVHQQIVKFLD